MSARDKPPRYLITATQATPSVIPAKAGIHLPLQPRLPVAQVCNLRRLSAKSWQPVSARDKPPRYLITVDASDAVRHSRASVDARPTGESIDARPTSESIDARHSRESGNPSSSESLDSGFHRSDDPQAAPSSGSAGLQPASEEGNDPAADTSGETLTQEFTALWHNARAIADRETFLHWEAAFPGVWAQWQDANPSGGFDAVIGNPPWDRIKLQEVEWFATRAPELARAPTAAARRTAIKELRARGRSAGGRF